MSAPVLVPETTFQRRPGTRSTTPETAPTPKAPFAPPPLNTSASLSAMTGPSVRAKRARGAPRDPRRGGERLPSAPFHERETLPSCDESPPDASARRPSFGRVRPGGAGAGRRRPVAPARVPGEIRSEGERRAV